MPSWVGKSKGTPLGYRIFVICIRRFGIRAAYGLLVFVAGYYYLFSYRSSRQILRLLRLRLGYPALRSMGLLYRNYYAFGQSLVDKILVFSGARVPFAFDFDGEHHLRRMVAEKKGGLLLSAHLGNWDIAGHLLRRLEAPVHVVMHDGEQAAIRDYLSSATGKSSAHIILLKEDLSHIFAIEEALQRGELVCLHADRFLPGNKTLPAKFLGLEAQFPAGPFLLASRFQVPVSFVFAMKEGNWRYHFYASEPEDYDWSDKEGTQRRLLDQYVRAIEKKVGKYPVQWYNYYDFWD
jgi:predicted LPLAT superfamily acyltransferase